MHIALKFCDNFFSKDECHVDPGTV